MKGNNIKINEVSMVKSVTGGYTVERCTESIFEKDHSFDHSL